MRRASLLVTVAAMITALVTVAVPAQAEVPSSTRIPGVQYAGADAPLTFSRDGNEVRVRMPSNTIVNSLDPNGRTGVASLKSLVQNWRTLGMTRKGASFWIRPAGASRVVHLGTPEFHNGEIVAFAPLDKWNKAVSRGSQLVDGPTRATRSSNSATTTVAIQSTSSVSPCPGAATNWTGTCVITGSNVRTQLWYYFNLGLSTSIAVCWELPTGPTSVGSVQSAVVDGSGGQANAVLQSSSKGACMGGSGTWIQSFDPAWVSGFSQTYAFGDSIKFVPPSALPVSTQSLFLRITTDPADAGGHDPTVQVLL